jgi:hypothetical protein
MTPVDICDRCGTFIIKGKCWCTPPLSDLLSDEHTPKMQAFVDALKQRQAAYDFRQECQRPDESAVVPAKPFDMLSFTNNALDMISAAIIKSLADTPEGR